MKYYEIIQARKGSLSGYLGSASPQAWRDQNWRQLVRPFLRKTPIQSALLINLTWTLSAVEFPRVKKECFGRILAVGKISLLSLTVAFGLVSPTIFTLHVLTFGNFTTLCSVQQ